MKKRTLKPVFTKTSAKFSISITVIVASTAQALAQARGSEDAQSTSKRVSTSRTKVFALVLMASENLQL